MQEQQKRKWIVILGEQISRWVFEPMGFSVLPSECFMHLGMEFTVLALLVGFALDAALPGALSTFTFKQVIAGTLIGFLYVYVRLIGITSLYKAALKNSLYFTLSDGEERERLERFIRETKSH